MVLASRKPVTRPVVVRTDPDMARADPDMARACPECHRSIYWGRERG